MLARAIHYCSRRADKAFVIEHCGALPDQLLEAELFGYKRGAFTGAYEDRSGRFQQADGGTIFLDEIGDTSPVFQVKLLRVLQEGEFRPLGAARPQSVDVRVVAATHHDLEADVRAGTFREDLYYRLATVTLHVPALRERAMDIPLLAGRLLEASQKVLGKSGRRLQHRGARLSRRLSVAGQRARAAERDPAHAGALSDSPRLGADLLAPRILRTPAVDQQAGPPARPDRRRWRPQGAHGSARGARAQGDADPPSLEQVAGGERAWPVARRPAQQAAALRAGARMKLLWLQAAGCGGCTQSLLGAESRAGVLAQFADSGLDFVLHPGLSEASGDEALALLRAAAAGRPAVRHPLRRRRAAARTERQRALPDPLRQRPAGDRLGARAGRTRPHVLAIGTCSAYGGIISAGENVTDACGLQFDGDQEGGLLGKDFPRGFGPAGDQRRRLPDASGLGRRHPALAGARRAGESDLDAWQRPRFYTEQLVHHGCPRNEFYEFKASAQKLSDLGCLMENLGCKGTQANADCNLRLVAWRRLMLARRLCLHFLHRAGLRGTRASVHGDRQDRRHPDRSAGRHAESVVRRARRAVQVGDAESGCARTHVPITR
jgi:hypothetical protein